MWQPSDPSLTLPPWLPDLLTGRPLPAPRYVITSLDRTHAASTAASCATGWALCCSDRRRSRWPVSTARGRGEGARSGEHPAGSLPTGHMLGRAKPQPWPSVLVGAHGGPSHYPGWCRPHLYSGWNQGPGLKATLPTHGTPVGCESSTPFYF